MYCFWKMLKVKSITNPASSNLNSTENPSTDGRDLLKLCKICNVPLSGPARWQEHINGKLHVNFTL